MALSDGRQIFAPSSDPLVPSRMANAIYGVIGLNNLAQVTSHATFPGSGPTGGYKPADIAMYLKQFGITGTLPLKNVLLSGADGSANSNTQNEVTLDTELLYVFAPHATIMVYEGASQPYATAVGGTKLTINADGTYGSESAWGNTSNGKGGGGGGISSVWPIPAWQASLANSANQGSTKMRMTPDVSLNANESTGYAIGVGGVFKVIGGTSAAAPLWAGFTTIVNQQRAKYGEQSLGFISPALYQIAQSSVYATTFHDVADLSTNLYYHAVPGYDLATGLGSPIGPQLLTTLAATRLPPAAPVNVTAKVVSP